MSHLAAEVSSFLAPDLEQPIALTRRSQSLTGTADPSFGPPASPVTSEPTPRPLKTPSRRPTPPRDRKLTWLASHQAFLTGFCVATVLTVVLIVLGAITHFVDQTPPDGNGVAILGTVTQFDWMGTEELFVTWSIVGHGEYGLQAMGGKSSAYSAVDRAVDVYLDDPTNPAFSYDPTLLPKALIGDIYVPQRSVSFDTVHRVTMNQRYYAPFGRYTFTAFAFVIDKATNTSIPITVFKLGNPGPTDFNMMSTEVLARNNFTYNATDGPATVEVESRIMLGAITHSVYAAASIIVMFWLCWGLCGWAVHASWTLLGRELEAKEGFTFLPITLIFSVPTIRGLYIGLLPFGVFLDVVGILPQMVILAYCAGNIVYTIMRATQDRITPPEGEKV